MTEVLRDGKGAEQIVRDQIVEETARSPQGVWYATKVRMKDVMHDGKGKSHDQILHIYVDFARRTARLAVRPPASGTAGLKRELTELVPKLRLGTQLSRSSASSSRPPRRLDVPPRRNRTSRSCGPKRSLGPRETLLCRRIWPIFSGSFYFAYLPLCPSCSSWLKNPPPEKCRWNH